MNPDSGMASEKGLSSLNPEEQLSCAERLFAVGAFAEAEQAYLAAIKGNEKLFQAHVGAARCARTWGDHLSSFRRFQAAMQLFPLAPGVHLECAADLLALGLLEEAEASYHKVLSLAPENVQAHAGLGHCARRRGSHSHALAHFQAAAAFSPGLHVLQQEIALEQLALGQLEEAEVSFHEVLRLSPHSAQAHAGLGHCARKSGRQAAALTHFQAAVASLPSLPGLRLEVAGTLRELGRLEEARSICHEVLHLFPGEFQAYLNLGQLNVPRVAQMQHWRPSARRMS